MNLWIQILVVLVPFLSCISADRKLLLQQKILDDILSGYDKRVRPFGRNGTGPVVVDVNAYVRSISDLDDEKMVYRAQLTFRQKWYDERCKYDRSLVDYITLTNLDKMWIPDLFFPNEMTGNFHSILTPNNFIRIYPNGQILYSTRVSLELFCPMDLRNYPMDRQVCSIKAASYGYTTKDIVFQWNMEHPVQIGKPNLHLPIFTLNSFDVDYCTSKTNTGEYSCIVVNFEFTRAFTFYTVQVFMPTLLLVILSWIPFWLHPHSLALRLGIWIGVLLSMMIVTTSVAENSPRVSYIKAIDVWIGACITFIFWVLIEMCLVNNAVTKENRRIGTNEVQEADKTMGMDDGVKNNSSKPTHYSSIPLKWLNKYSTQAQRIDAVSRFLFPVAFAFFSFVYWLTYSLK